MEHHHHQCHVLNSMITQKYVHSELSRRRCVGNDEEREREKEELSVLILRWLVVGTDGPGIVVVGTVGSGIVTDNVLVLVLWWWWLGLLFLVST